jgi:hypothetical protein
MPRTREMGGGASVIDIDYDRGEKEKEDKDDGIHQRGDKGGV